MICVAHIRKFIFAATLALVVSVGHAQTWRDQRPEGRAIGESTVRPAYHGRIIGKDDPRYTEGLKVDWAATSRLYLDRVVDFYDHWICGHLELGLRYGYKKISKDQKWDEVSQTGFVGTIATLVEEQSKLPDSFFLYYGISEWAGVSLSFDRISAVARTHTFDLHDDGEFSASSVSLSFVASASGLSLADGRLVPYAELGCAFSSAKFSPYDWWRLGYPADDYYRGLGSPEKPLNHKTRSIEAEASPVIGLTCGLGVKYSLSSNWLLDLSWRYLSVNAKARYFFRVGSDEIYDQKVHDIPLSHSVFGLGVRYAF